MGSLQVAVSGRAEGTRGEPRRRHVRELMLRSLPDGDGGDVALGWVSSPGEQGELLVHSGVRIFFRFPFLRFDSIHTGAGGKEPPRKIWWVGA